MLASVSNQWFCPLTFDTFVEHWHNIFAGFLTCWWNDFEWPWYGETMFDEKMFNDTVFDEMTFVEVMLDEITFDEMAFDEMVLIN